MVQLSAALIENFWAQVAKKGQNDCWLWLGNTRREYGRYNYKKVDQQAHRFSWLLAFGEIEPNLCVCHHCDTPLCVNPYHFFKGTHKDNAADRDAKGRNAQREGEEHGQAKLTVEAVRAVRAEYAKGNRLIHAWARQYGVSRGTILQMLQRKTWRHVV